MNELGPGQALDDCLANLKNEEYWKRIETAAGASRLMRLWEDLRLNRYATCRAFSRSPRPRQRPWS
ncbi:MAG: hypothetical protein ACE5JX_22480, partial [Acidobacteriota bacterium]